jgi:DNA-binding NarL/FixJ family response regulator
LIDELLAKIESIMKFADDQRETVIRELSTDMMKYFNSKITGKHEDINLSLEPENISDELYIKHGVSKKEIEIIHLLDLGYEYKEIGDKLNISINTVREYIRRLYLKCGVNNKMELTRIFHP